ncbi:MAG TPA: septum site-determining protein Ssd, partial [Mycobacteriales bacterium]|nr:septum site-determining protein Ssd [Mycobacteriales bacterium]
MAALLITDDTALATEITEIAARGGGHVDVARSLLFAGPQWVRAATVLVDARAEGPAPSRRANVVLVGHDLDDATVWDRAVQLGAEHVVFLPDAADWLADLLAGPLPDPDGHVLAVVGGAGGVGASTLAVTTSLVGAADGPTLLVDLDPWGGGLDVLLGLEADEGTRWDTALLAPAPGGRRVVPHATLPQVGDLAVLSCPRSGPVPLPVDAVADVLDAAPARYGRTVVDLGRTDGALIATACSRATTTALVVPARVRGLAAALPVAALVADVADDVRVVVRAGRDLTPDDVGRALGLP